MSRNTKIGIGVAVLAVIGVVVGILVTRPKGGFEFATQTYSVNVPITRSGTVDITLTPPQGKKFPTGDITFSVKETPPTGVKATFNPSTVKAKGDEKSIKTVLTLEATGTARTGSHPLTVVAKGGGVTKEAKLTLTVQVAPDYTLEVSPATVTVKQGATGTVTVNLKRTETMKDAVDLSVSGAPTGVKVTLDPSKVPADKTSATLKIEVASTVEAKDYTLTITGKAPGLADKSASLKLNVQLVDFSLKPEPSVVTLAPGGTATLKITITRTNLTDPVTFKAVNVPAGLTVTFDPPSVTGTETKVTISAAAEAAPGNYVLTIEGTAAGKTKTVNISVAVGGS